MFINSHQVHRGRIGKVVDEETLEVIESLF